MSPPLCENRFTVARVKFLANAVNVFAQWLMANGVIGLHVKCVGQRQFVQFTGNHGNCRNGQVSPQRKVYVGIGLKISLRARAENSRLRHISVPAQNSADHFLLGVCQSKRIHDALRCFRKSCSSFSAGKNPDILRTA